MHCVSYDVKRTGTTQTYFSLGVSHFVERCWGRGALAHTLSFSYKRQEWYNNDASYTRVHDILDFS